MPMHASENVIRELKSELTWGVCRDCNLCDFWAYTYVFGVLHMYTYPTRQKNPALNSRVLLSSFTASIGLMYCIVRSCETVLDHGCSGEGRLATQTTTQ